MKHIAIALVLLVGVVSAQSKPRAPNQSKGENEPPGASSDRAGSGRFHLLAVKAPWAFSGWGYSGVRRTLSLRQRERANLEIRSIDLYRTERRPRRNFRRLILLRGHR
jgi:hypothetical protein